MLGKFQTVADDIGDILYFRGLVVMGKDDCPFLFLELFYSSIQPKTHTYYVPILIGWSIFFNRVAMESAAR